MKITIIGAGNMGGALAWGLARSGAVPASDLTVTARHEEKLEKFKALGLQTATDNVEAVRGSDLVFYAVKPWQMEARWSGKRPPYWITAGRRPSRWLPASGRRT